MPADFGTDVDCVLDLDPMFRPVTGAIAVGQAVARRLSCVNGAWFASQDYGYGLLDRLNDSQDPGTIAAIQSGVEREALKDERVESAVAVALFTEAESRLTVALACETSEGPFELVLGVADLTLELLGLTAG